jgi:hypothetical protein
MMKELNTVLIHYDPIIQTNIIENEAIKNVIIENDVDTNYEYVEVEDVRFIRNMTQKKIDLKIKKDSMREHNNHFEIYTFLMMHFSVSYP